jgi:uncharacterized protein YjlB
MYDIYKIIEDFVEVCKYAEINITKNDIVIEILEAGVTHLQNSLPKDNMAVYIFLNKRKDLCYKVGKVGVKSNDRYKYHHYNSNSSKSNLAASILKDPDFNGIIEIQKSIKTWIKKY